MEQLKRRIAILLSLILATVLAVAATLFLILNSGMLDQWALEQAVAYFNKEFRGRLELRELHLKFPNQVILVEPRLYAPETALPTLSASELSARLNFLPLLEPRLNTLRFREIHADSLSARIVEKEDGSLNIEEIFSPRIPDSTETGIENWFIHRLQLEKCGISWTARDKGGKLQDALRVEDIALSLDHFRLSPEYLRGSVEALAFRMPSRAFQLRKGSGKFRISEERVEILNLRAESPRSSAWLSLSLDGINLFAPDSAKATLKGNSSINVRHLAIDSRDANGFLPAHILPEGLYRLEGKASSAPGKVVLHNLRLGMGESSLALQGEVWNPLNPKALAYQLQIDSSRVSAKLLAAIADDNRLEAIGTARFSGQLSGTLKGIKGSLAFSSDAGSGSIEGNLSEDTAGSISYEAKLLAEGLEPHRIIGGKTSRVNGTVTITGQQRGSSLERLKASVQINKSVWQRQPISTGSLQVRFEKRQGDITLDASGGESRITLSGKLDFRGKEPAYRATGELKGLNLSRLEAEGGTETNLNAKIALEGKSFTLEGLNGSLDVRFSPSAINGYHVRGGEHLQATLTQQSGSASVGISSSFMEFSMNGAYRLDQLADLAGYAVAGIAREAAMQDIWRKPPRPTTIRPASLSEPLRATYRLRVKESRPIAMALPIEGIDFSGSASGTIASTPGNCAIDAAVKIDTIGDGESFEAKGIQFEASLACNDEGIPKAEVKSQARGLNIGGQSGSLESFSASYHHGRITLQGAASAAGTASRVALDIQAERTASQYNLTFNTLRLADSSGAWGLIGKPVITADRSSVRFNRFRVSKGMQQILLDGTMSGTDPGTFTLEVDKLRLDELQQLLPSSPVLKLLSGTLDASLRVSGGAGEKTSVLQLDGQGLRYGNFALGTIAATTRHEGKRLSFTYRSAESNSNNTIKGSGTVPVALEYYPLKMALLERERINVSFQSDNLSASILQYALPLFSEANGALPTSIRVSGRAGDPDITLHSQLRQTKLRIAPTEVAYSVDGDIVLARDVLELRNLALQDSLKGKGTINGTMRLEDLEPGPMNIEARFRNLLVYNKKDRRDETSYGTITASSRGVQLLGSLEAPVLEGSLQVDAALFALYRTGANESSQYVGMERFIEFVPRYPEATAAKEEKKGKGALRKVEFYYSLIDILEIKDLRLSSQAPLRYVMIFDRERGERLETMVNDLSLVVNKRGQKYRLFGAVNVVEGKYQFSNTTFSLEPGGRIAWNNAEIREGLITRLYASRFASVLNTATGERDNVKLVLAITGTINEPMVVMGYYLNEQSQPYAATNMLGSQAAQYDPNAELNVISMMLSRQWYIRPGSNGQGGSFAASSIGLSAGSGLVSAQLSNAIRDLAGLESFNVNLATAKDGSLSGVDLYFAMEVPGTEGRMRVIASGRAADMEESSMFGQYGTAQKVEYRLTSKVFVEGYRSYGMTEYGASHYNLQQPEEIWGVSLLYRERFHTWSQFWDRITGQEKRPWRKSGKETQGATQKEKQSGTIEER